LFQSWEHVLVTFSVANANIKVQTMNKRCVIRICRRFRSLQSQVDLKYVLLLHLFCDLGKIRSVTMQLPSSTLDLQQQFSWLKFYCLSKKDQST
jgi:hypothetical protein